MEYDQNDKLQKEVEKLEQEVKFLKNPFRQPTLWLALFALALSIPGNFIQWNLSEYKAIIVEAKRVKAEDELSKTLAQIKSAKAYVEILSQKLSSTRKQFENVKKKESSKTDVSKKEFNKALNDAIDIIDNAEKAAQQTTNGLDNSESVLEGKTQNLPEKIAERKEREGFQALIDEDYDRAIEAFQTAEDARPKYHNVYELAKILRENKDEMKKNPAKKKEIFKIIAVKLYWKAPPDLIKQVKEIAEE